MFTKEQIDEIRVRLADTGKKDSQFDAAELPLQGDETVTIIQNQENRSLPVSSMTQDIEDAIRQDFQDIVDEAVEDIPIKSESGVNSAVLINSGNTASGDGAFAVGINNTSAAGCSTSEGHSNIASGYCSHAEGKGTTIETEAGHVEGKFNYNSNAIHVIGIGTAASDKKDAEVITTTGDKYLIGVGGYQGTSTSGKKTVQQVITDTDVRVSAIEDVIPSQAGEENKLADENYVNTKLIPLAGYVLEMGEGSTPFQEFIQTLNTATPTTFNTTVFLPFILDTAKNNSWPRLIVKTTESNTSEEICYRVTYPAEPAPDFDIEFIFTSSTGDSVTLEEETFTAFRVAIQIFDDEITDITVEGVSA